MSPDDRRPGMKSPRSCGQKTKIFIWTILAMITVVAYCMFVDWWVTSPAREYIPVRDNIRVEMAKRGPLYLYVENENGEISYQTESGKCFIRKKGKGI
jgi:hypothetical protein